MNQNQDQKKSLANPNTQVQPAEQPSREAAPKHALRVQEAAVVVIPTPEELFFIKRRWEGRIGHPRKLMASTRAALEDLGYSVVGSYDDKTAPMRDTSYFQGTIVAKFDQQKTNYGLLILGLVTLPVIVGYWIIKAAPEVKRSLIRIVFEGESYYVGAHEGRLVQESVQGRSAHTERAGVVSDIRVTLKAGIGSAQGEDELKDGLYPQKSELVELTNTAADQLSALWKDLAIA
ncbi:MAG: hypothetical protein HY663_00820 [Chloroflexi bacterium]|nr:hypothetical protein [Chloroflexota bacterium]